MSTAVQRSCIDRGSDLVLAREAAAGSTVARRAIADRLYDRICRAMLYLVGGADAEDLTHVALVHILQKIGGFRGDSSLECWAERVAVKLALSHMKKTRRRERLAESMDGEDDLARPTDPEEALSAGIVRERLSEHLQLLSPERRAVLVMHHVLGHGLEEIASLTGASIHTVRDRLYTARKLLRDLVLDDPHLEGFADGRQP